MLCKRARRKWPSKWTKNTEIWSWLQKRIYYPCVGSGQNMSLFVFGGSGLLIQEWWGQKLPSFVFGPHIYLISCPRVVFTMFFSQQRLVTKIVISILINCYLKKRSTIFFVNLQKIIKNDVLSLDHTWKHVFPFNFHKKSP